MNIYQNIKNMCDQAGISTYRLCQELGFSTALMSQWKNGRQEPSRKKLQQIADYFKVPVEQLIVGDAETKKSPDVMSEDNQTNKFLNALKNNPDIFPVVPTRKVPILGSIACGTPILAQENIEGYLDVEVKSNVTFALKCKGDSMAPKLLDEDVVLIHRQPVVENGETAAVLIGEEATLKRVYIRDNSIILAPENLNYEPIHLTGEEMSNVSILGKVVGYVRYF